MSRPKFRMLSGTGANSLSMGGGRLALVGSRPVYHDESVDNQTLVLANPFEPWNDAVIAPAVLRRDRNTNTSSRHPLRRLFTFTLLSNKRIYRVRERKWSLIRVTWSVHPAIANTREYPY
jgi:hypothetical protein